MVSQSADNALRLHTVEMVLDIKIRLAFSLNRTDHAGRFELFAGTQTFTSSLKFHKMDSAERMYCNARTISGIFPARRADLNLKSSHRS